MKSKKSMNRVVSLRLVSFLIFSLILFQLVSCKKNNARHIQEKDEQVSVLDDIQTNVDVDLTKLNSLMVYSEVFNMLVEPENYIGKTIRMKGLFYCSDDDPQADLPRRIFACIIQDATACCAQGLEFRLKDELAYPHDFPPTNSEITVTGVFFHEEDNFDFFGIKDAVLEM